MSLNPDALLECDYRLGTEVSGVYFCQHTQVNTANHLVTASICRDCTRRYTPAPRRTRYATPVVPREISGRLQYIATEQLIRDTRELASRLPSNLAAVAGIPRSGMIPATFLATLLHLPLYEVSQSAGLRPVGHGLRLKPGTVPPGPLLVIDDSVHAGIAIKAARQVVDSCAPGTRPIYAAVYPRPEKAGLLDLYARLCPAPHLFEWNLYNCVDAQHYAFDMDGVICHDWDGDNSDGPGYEDFLQNARPRWLPRRLAIPLIVTARLERYRAVTLDWLRRYGVRVKELVMGPWKTAAQRRRTYSAADFKGKAYADSRCRLFIESDNRQAEAIFRAARKPVLCASTGNLFQ